MTRGNAGKPLSGDESLWLGVSRKITEQEKRKANCSCFVVCSYDSIRRQPVKSRHFRIRQNGSESRRRQDTAGKNGNYKMGARLCEEDR